MRHRVIVNTAFSKIWTLLLGTSDEIDQKEVIGGGRNDKGSFKDAWRQNKEFNPFTPVGFPIDK